MTDITDWSDYYLGPGNTNGRDSVGGSVQGMLDIDGDVGLAPRQPGSRQNATAVNMRGTESGGRILADSFLRVFSEIDYLEFGHKGQNEDKAANGNDSEFALNALVAGHQMIEANTQALAPIGLRWKRYPASVVPKVPYPVNPQANPRILRQQI